MSTSAASRAPAAGTDRPPDSAPVSVATPPTKALPDRSPESALSSTSTPLAQETISRLPEQRTALVIGNAAYEREIGDLQNPVNDAEDVATALRQANFQVTLLPNASYEQMEKAVRAFHEQLRRHNGVGLFYFAGHGAELDGIGYLIPLRSGIRDRWELSYKALNVRYIQTAMGEAGNRLNIIILDACRDIPVFEASDRKLRGRGSSPQRGLPPIIAEPDMLIAYATSPGQTALDGGENDRNGIYTKHLLRVITVPGMSAEEVFREVRRGVREETGERQRPWESVSLSERFEFFPLSSEPSVLLPVRGQHMR